MMIRIVTAVLSCVAIAACADLAGVDGAQAELRTDRASYRIGETGALSLTNHGDDDIGHSWNLCLKQIDQRVGGEWKAAESQFARVCLLPLYMLPPGQTITRSFPIVEPYFHPGGEYRFVMGIEDQRTGENVGITSNSFTVEE